MIPRPRLRRSWPAGPSEPGSGLADLRVIGWDGLVPSIRGLIQQLAGQASEMPRFLDLHDLLVVTGSVAEFQALACGLEAGGYADEARLLLEVVAAPDLVRTLKLPNRVLAFARPAVIGIVNVTPDSFYDGGRNRDSTDAVRRGLEMIEAGAGVVEVGGERAAPGRPVSVAEELDRVIPVVEGIRAASDVPISIDTRKPEVARRAVAAGASIVNDIDGMRDRAMRAVIAETGAAAVVMHIQGEPRIHQPNPVYDSVMGDVTAFLHRQIAVMLSEGISGDRMAIDPGPGFGKQAEHDLNLMACWHELRGFPYPLVLAISRKGFIGQTLDLPPVERLPATLAVTALAVAAGCDLVRTHDVAETVQTVSMISEVMRHGCR